MLRLSVRPGDLLQDAEAFDVHVAGSEANVAYAAARVGLRSAWVSALPANTLGRRVAGTLAAGGVDTSGVRWVDGARRSSTGHSGGSGTRQSSREATTIPVIP